MVGSQGVVRVQDLERHLAPGRDLLAAEDRAEPTLADLVLDEVTVVQRATLRRVRTDVRLGSDRVNVHGHPPLDAPDRPTGSVPRGSAGRAGATVRRSPHSPQKLAWGSVSAPHRGQAAGTMAMRTLRAPPEPRLPERGAVAGLGCFSPSGGRSALGVSTSLEVAAAAALRACARAPGRGCVRNGRSRPRRRRQQRDQEEAQHGIASPERFAAPAAGSDRRHRHGGASCAAAGERMASFGTVTSTVTFSAMSLRTRGGSEGSQPGS